MTQLVYTKCRFLFCLVICISIGTIIYLKATVVDKPGPQDPVLTQKPTSERRPSWGLGQNVTSQQARRLELYFKAPLLNCTGFLSDFHFINKALSKEEEDYPLAFILTIHKELRTFVRLLRAIYAPQNVYCVHVDKKASPEYKNSVQQLAGCFDNVLLASVTEKVTYAGFSRLKADINCMRDLVNLTVPWKKVINLCGQDFPIQSNLELVRYVQNKEWFDQNLTPGVKQPAAHSHRTKYQYKEFPSHVDQVGKDKLKGPPPHNLSIYFGTAYYSLTRQFVRFVLESPVAKDLLEWSRDTYSPDEHYWVTLNHIKDAPGSRVNGGWEGAVRAIKWKDQEGTAHSGCKGHYIRDICIYGIEDIPWLIKKQYMFANKFESESYPEALTCLEQWHRLKVLQQANVTIEPSWRMLHEVNISQCCNGVAELNQTLLCAT